MPDFDRLDDARVVRDLLTATPTPDLRYDVDATLRTGHRVRTRRRLAAAGGGVVAAGIVAATLALSGVLPTDDALPSGRNDSQVAGRSSVELLDYRYAVEVQPAADGQVTVTTYSVDAGKRTKLDSWTAGATSEGVWLGPSADGVTLGIAPVEAVALVPLTAGDGAPVMKDVRPLPGTAYQAVALRLLDSEASTPIDDVVWTTAVGAFDASGAPLPSVEGPTEDSRLVLHPTKRLMLNIGPNSGSTQSYATDSTPWVGDQLDERSDVAQFLAATLVIPTNGAVPREVSVNWSNGQSTKAPLIGESQGWTFVHTFRAKPKAVPSGEVRPTEVTWTDTSGTRHTEPLKMKLG